MGNYAVVSDVQALINSSQFTIGATSIPSQTTVMGWIADFEGEIDVLLASCGATVPVTDSRDVARLKRLVAEKVAATTWNAAFTDIEEPDYVAEWRSRYKRVIEQMQNCAFALISQPDVGQSAGRRMTVSSIRVLPSEDTENGS